MRLDEMTPVMPERDWDELITVSMRRGRSLRRRRRALLASPVAAVAAFVLSLPLTGVFGPGKDGLARLQTTNVTPTQSSSPSPSPAATGEPMPLPSGPHLGGLTPAAVNVWPPAARHAGPGPVVPSEVVSAAHGATSNVSPVTIAYADPQGDATPQAAPNAPATPSAAATSDPTLDVTRMSFAADRNALRITMRLLGDYRTDGYYLAYFTDARTSCAYTVLLGGGYHDQIWWACGSDAGGDYLQGTADSARALNAVVPLASLRGGVRPHDSFTSLNGETRLVHPAGGQWPYDEAATAKVLTLP